jgi:endonuclease YncB( thermonuclease family)
VSQIIVAAILLLAAPAFADTLTGKVVKVTDGDTITVTLLVNTQRRVRLAGIDAPEKGQPYGNASRKHLASLVAGKQVTIEYNKYDRYGRIVGQVWVASPDACPDQRPDCPKTLSAGLAQVTVGLAWHYKKYQHEQSAEDRERYAFTEEEARARKIGLWQDKNPLPPWEWRRLNR